MKRSLLISLTIVTVLLMSAMQKPNGVIMEVAGGMVGAWVRGQL